MASGLLSKYGLLWQVTEQYSFSRQTSMARRDLRSGQQTARAMLDAEGVRLSISWGEPNAGVGLPVLLPASHSSLHLLLPVRVATPEVIVWVSHRLALIFISFAALQHASRTCTGWKHWIS